jgi:NTP pyrophosphatase (non-canonical NTP hydrolase)
MTQRSVSRQVIDHFGAYHQLAKSGEEASEYSGAILRYMQCVIRDDNTNIGDFRKAAIKELADVIFTAAQARIILGEDAVDRVIQEIETDIMRQIAIERAR